jgi:GNAT superfamily N-acetyltransferase
MGEQARVVGENGTDVSVSGFELRRATVNDVSRLKRVYAEAFYRDPIIEWMIPDERSRLQRSRRFFAIELRHVALARGAVWTTTELSGAAMSVTPGAWRMPLRAFLLEGTTFGRWQLRAGRLAAAMQRRHPRQPSYYFRDIGVLPEKQGRGLGGALMRPTLERCDREGLPAYLEATSERSAALYERLGFQLTDELRVGGSPPLWLMLRPPLAPTP